MYIILNKIIYNNIIHKNIYIALNFLFMSNLDKYNSIFLSMSLHLVK